MELFGDVVWNTTKTHPDKTDCWPIWYSINRELHLENIAMGHVTSPGDHCWSYSPGTLSCSEATTITGTSRWLIFKWVAVIWLTERLGTRAAVPVLATRAPFQYPIRRLMVRSHKVLKLQDLYLELYDRSEIWQAPRQQCCRGACLISKWYDNSNYQFHDFRDFTRSYDKTS